MGTNRTNKSYVDGVAAFIDYAVHNLQKMGNIDLRVNKRHLLIPCPCTKCLNHIEHKVEEVQFHLFRNRIDLSYTNWTRHGEKGEPSISTPEPVNATTEFVDDTDFALDIPTDGPATVEMVNATKYNFDEDDFVKIPDGVLRHPADSQAWCTMYEKFPEIAKDPKNLRLGISADGVDVNTGNRHHKQLVDDLHTLFETEVDTYDVSTKDNFNLRAVVLWTINDYPALGTLCGCPYSGFKGCVVCGKDTNCVRLSASSKQSYVGHRRYLPYNHPFRKQKKAFNGQQEFLPAPIPMTGEQIYNEYRKLRYWRHNSVPHCIDSMNVEKNVAKSLVGTLLHVLGKMKDRVNARLDMAELGSNQSCLLCKKKTKQHYLQQVIKGHVRNRNKLEGCIVEETIAEETIKFFSEYHKFMETIGIPPDKHETDENEEGKPLRHKQVLKTEYPGKRIAFLENEHSKSFAMRLRKEVKRELVISKESVSKNVRWISYGPRATVVKYDAYNINRYTFCTKCHDGKVYQNNGVSVEAIDLHISKEVATIRQAFYYGVLQEIWVLDYRFRQIPLFKCDWVNHRAGGVKRDNLSLHIAFAACICTLHLYIAFASKHLHIAFADCICTLLLYIAFAACICKQAFAHCICRLLYLLKPYKKVKQVENKQREKKPRFNKQFL
ncbi:putative ribonuclease H-like domain-containing protein [Tanacetum coccineum]